MHTGRDAPPVSLPLAVAETTSFHTSLYDSYDNIVLWLLLAVCQKK